MSPAAGLAPRLSFPFSTPQNANIFSLFPSSFLSPVSITTLSPRSSSLSFLSTAKLHSLSFLALCPAAFPSHSQNPQFITSYQDQKEEEEEEEEQVIGDCLIFEDGIFEDPFLEEELNPPIPSISSTTHKPKGNKKPTTVPEIEPQNLVPEEWGQIVEEINLTKKERRKIAQEMEFGQRIEKKQQLRKVNFEEYLRVKNEKLSQLKPLVLVNPLGFPTERKAGKERDGEEGNLRRERENVSSSGSARVEPRNPRWAVYGRGLDDISEFFNSGNYQPSDEKSGGRQKLFTMEERALMNARAPKLAVATSQKWLPIHTLAASGEFYLLNTLLQYNVDIDAADQDGLTALHKAVTCKKQAVTNYLLRESANPLVRDKDGATLIHYAVRTASSQAIKILLLHNVDINLQDNDGWTPLHLAVQARRTDVVRLLLMKGADKTLRNRDGLTPLGLCLYSGRDSKALELIKLLKQLPRRHR